jgi:hypothetical protein
MIVSPDLHPVNVPPGGGTLPPAHDQLVCSLGYTDSCGVCRARYRARLREQLAARLDERDLVPVLLDLLLEEVLK